MPKEAVLTLQDGTRFSGIQLTGQKHPISGEVVFNTGMTGYVESLTDPSYAGQILVFTYPLIGNYGVARKAGESEKIQVAGVVVSEAAAVFSHKSAESSLLAWLHSQRVPLIGGIDTRQLTKHLRTHGSMMGGFNMAAQDIPDISQHFVSITKPKLYNPGHKKRVILVDCGMKRNILRSLMKLPITIKRVPFGYDYTNETFDGILLSNGPGDPEKYVQTIAITRTALKLQKPVFGICLGNQILASAAGAKTYKLPFGHRGHNQPCIHSKTKRCVITSQNHSYAIDEKSLPEKWRVLFRNLNDGSVEGIEHASQPFFSVQFHPEAAPGPTDTQYLFERFYKSL